VAAQSKACVCGRSLAGIVGSKPAGGIVCLLCGCFLSLVRDFCDGPITRPEYTYQVYVCH
jgi:hypothetical protein